MPNRRPLLMIPGPVEISPTVRAAAGGAPPGHLDPEFQAAFAAALAAMRQVWLAPPEAVPFAVPGGGTLAMEAAATNLVAPGERALVVSTGVFGDRMAEMLRRRGAALETLAAAPGDAPPPGRIEATLATAADAGRPFKALFATHVDTSTGVRLDPEPLARAARRHGTLSVFDGVCATGGERFEMEEWGADVYFTASQKALGLPPGLALWVAGPRALEARRELAAPPPLVLDWEAWRPVFEAYEAGRGAYFSTPPTSLVLALRAGLGELLEDADEPRAAMAAVFAAHQRCARALRAAWRVLGLASVPVRPALEANTLSALVFPAGRGTELITAIRAHGVAVAGGLHPALVGTYFRVGHMGWATRSPELLLRTVDAISAAVAGAGSVTAREAVEAFETGFASAPLSTAPAGSGRATGD
jgi:alanine-glyoxylate transaminase/serine-glyoxylate transaminase/serine-pyruvate transaminase